MANPKQKDIDLLQSEVASFASSLGLSSSLPSSGFNDVDFRKTKPLTKPQKPKKEKPISTKTGKDTNATGGGNTNNMEKNFKRPFSKPTPKPPILSLPDNKSGSSGKFDKFKSLPKLPMVKASELGVWYEDAMQLEKKVLGNDKPSGVNISVEERKRMVEKKREVGERLLWQYGEDYLKSKGQDGEIKSLLTTQRTGTAADKVAALSVLVGDNPLANLKSLDNLLGLITTKVGKRHCLTGFEALKEFFISSLLPDRKLKTLLQRPLNDVPETKDGYSLLLFWYWEDCLKQRYERFVFALEEASRDVLPVLKDKALKTIYALLKSKSEQERRLLCAIVNKLGDPKDKGASNADFHLSNILSDHPNMKAVIIDEVDSFLFRPHLGLRAKYHAVNFLSHVCLTHKGDGPKVAKRLIDVYFALFKLLINEAGGSEKNDKKSKQEKRTTQVPSKGGDEKSSTESHVELDSRILSALLTGVNRAFPYVSSTEVDDIIEVQTPMLFQLVHSKNFNIGIQALMLLDKISSRNQIISDRFYRALYSKLLLPATMNSSKVEMFIGLLMRTMRSDINLKRVAAFSKRLLQVALQCPPQYACGCLFLLSEVLKARPPLWNMVLQNESVDDDLEHFEDVVEETNNEVHKESKKEENDLEDVQRTDEDKTESDSSDDEVEPPASSSEDVSDEDDDLHIEDSSITLKPQPLSIPAANQLKVSSTVSSLPGGYNPRHREPSFCNAHRTSWWELLILASHVHPSVATMAGTLLSGANIVYNGNPLNDLSLTAFLDKFMEKKPKQTTWHGGSQIEPAKKLDMNSHLIGPEILSLAEMDVPPEDLVFHKFYVNKMNTAKPKKKKKKKKGTEEEAAEDLFGVDDEVDDGDESDNEEIESMLNSADFSLEPEDGYDYDDLDRVANEDDEDLVGNLSDAEMDFPSDTAESEDEDFATTGGDKRNNNDDDDDDDDCGTNDIAIGDADDSGDDAVSIGNIDDDSTDEGGSNKRKRKPKASGKVGKSPFASLEEYEHLMNENGTSPGEKKSFKKKRPKSRKKRKSSG